jgi:hypothetical protein
VLSRHDGHMHFAYESSIVGTRFYQKDGPVSGRETPDSRRPGRS